MKHECQVEIIEPDNWERYKGAPCGYGSAFTDIKYWKEGNLWYVSNDEYTTIINFCPFCGIKLEIK